MGKFDGETFFGWVVDFFLGGAGGEEKAPGHGQQGRSLDDARFQTAPFVLYYILRSGSFAAGCVRPSRKVTTILDALGRQVRCSGFDSPSTSPRI
jgi:hypothetical protein